MATKHPNQHGDRCGLQQTQMQRLASSGYQLRPLPKLFEGPHKGSKK